MQRYRLAARRRSGLHWSRRRLYPATAILLGAIAASAAIVGLWFAGEPAIVQFFDQWQASIADPAAWGQAPEFMSPYLFWLPTLLMAGVVQFVMAISPQPRAWSRAAIAGILLVAIGRYAVWRSLATLNLDNPINGLASLLLYGMELLLMASAILRLCLFLKLGSRREQADRLSEAVLTGQYLPSADILIPTYNEPVSILRRTIVGCQAIDYPHKRVYLLDDGKRREVAELARQLGCEYVTRPNNCHAKAGNLNHALNHTAGELIAIFDADFVPTTNFLNRTVGFFQDGAVSLLQTHQSFYNCDALSRNLGLDKVIPQEQEIFFRYIQPLRDTNGSTLCAGSSFVARRSSLAAIGGFVTESLSEDYYTGLRLSAGGDRTIYLDEILSAGLCAENISTHIVQRQRWAKGTMQAFFMKSSPFNIPGLSWLQRLTHLEGVFQWFFGTFRIVFLILPLLYVSFGIAPMRVTLSDWLYFFLPYYIVQLLTLSWLSRRSRLAIISDVYDVGQCIPVSVAMFDTLIRPFTSKFRVTPKGVSTDRHEFNWHLAWPLIGLWLLSAACLIFNGHAAFGSGDRISRAVDNGLTGSTNTSLAWVWIAYNLFILSLALLMMLDVPKPSIYEWFDQQRPGRLIGGDRQYEGTVTRMSEIGAEIELSQLPDRNEAIELELEGTGLSLAGRIVRTRSLAERNSHLAQVKFEPMSLAQSRRTIELLFCQPGQWQPLQAPTELKSLGLMLKLFFEPVRWLAQKAWSRLAKRALRA
ncbi:glycosyltransferase [Synechococcus sp. PCC 7336]|uniref:glycosyltransferase n=1 Tax=Synechococcus sp. PCC 7336 TaxID=195250 RepID=UPI00034A1891|nr:glycosyltransferase [Synechococcus sp. PCC 7336]